jgi:hypothetical protein
MTTTAQSRIYDDSLATGSETYDANSAARYDVNLDGNTSRSSLKTAASSSQQASA